MTAQIIFSIFCGLIIGIALTLIYFREQLKQLQSKLEQNEILYRKEIDEARSSGLSVVTFPYSEEHGDDGVFVDDRTAEVGYKYQLFIQGVPCFEPHKVPIQVLTKKEVSSAKIEQVIQQALTVIESIASKHPAIAVAKVAPSVLGK